MASVNSGEIAAADRDRGRFAPDHNIPNWRHGRAAERRELRQQWITHYGGEGALSAGELIWLDSAVELLVRARHCRNDNDAVRLSRAAEHLLAKIDAKPPKASVSLPSLAEMLTERAEPVAVAHEDTPHG